MKLAKIILGLLMAFMMSTACACPKGQHPHGGTGSHHKGGYCSYDK